MNPALTPISEIRTMNPEQLIAYAKEHSQLTILEREMLIRLEQFVKAERTKQILNKIVHDPRDKKVQGIVDWAKQRMGDV